MDPNEKGRLEEDLDEMLAPPESTEEPEDEDEQETEEP